MGQFFDEIPDFLFPWIKQQKMFWVATAPLSPSGHVNVSPKGFDGTFRILSKSKVWYEDLTGSGIETTAHLRENGRLTIMFCAFEGPPRILRLFGTGAVYEYGTAEYNELLPAEKRQPGSRSVIMLDVHKVGTSCGYSIPFYTFKSNRMRLHIGMAKRELEDIRNESTTTSANGNGVPTSSALVSDKGLKVYWELANQKSIDGLPGLLTSFTARAGFDKGVASRDWGQDDESLISPGKQSFSLGHYVDARVVVGFVLGFVASGLWGRILRTQLAHN
ncbi:hypothetical protein NLJ89_g8642 [Agrocybe chaxingu]|uniref:Pyridoxamine 5'-phosphate oxidase N-terminal domain-containing protein n=1 Tax=Agrocybe chaxingu TaxID=84603 RepID=A0A9W8JX56_9AGAR|nr:hypothetical protein NLJ89_g8642 [Agrocybe chaxingu]